MKQNITLAMDKELIKKAKTLAARKETSVTRLLSGYLEHVVQHEERYQAAKRKALQKLRQGYHLGGTGIKSREELHAR